jgi:integrase
MLYVRVNGKRVSCKLEDTKANRKHVRSRYKNDEFFEKFNVKKEYPNILELCEEVLREKESTLKSSSYLIYCSVFRTSIVPHFDKYVNEIKPKHIEAWYKTFTSSSGIVTAEAILKPAFEKALLNEYINDTPFKVKKPRIKSTYQVNPFTLDEIDLILKNEDSWFRNFIAISFYSGLRTGEILALSWKDIDFDNFTIDVNKNQTNGFLQTPKTKSSVRIIDMLPQAEMYLKKQRMLTGLKELVFYSNENNILKGASSLSWNWTKILKNSKVEYRNIYQLRHSFASNMLSNNESLNWVSQMLGHKNPSITQEKYFKYIPRKVSGRKITFLDEESTKSTHMA